MPWFIKGTDEEGLFIGQFMGLGFFGSAIKGGLCFPVEEPIEFGSEIEAQTFLESWEDGSAGCSVVFLPKG